MNDKNISVVGIGKLGLCFSLSLESAGYNVIGVDLNEDYIRKLNQKDFFSEEPQVNEKLKKSKNFLATTDLKKSLDHSDIVFLVVATPSLPNGRYDHSQIEAVVKKIKTFGKQKIKKHLVVNCTTMPEYCEKLQKKIKKFNWTVSYNPEFIAQGTVIHNQENPDMVLIGCNDVSAGNRIEEIYKTFTKNNPKIFKMTNTEAEICKISLNCFLTTKIAYTNMIGDIVTAAGGQPQTVLNAIGSDTRVGNKLTRYGYGFGGPCFPRDNRALGIFARQKKIKAYISESTDKSNKDHLNFQIKQFLSSGIKEVIIESVTYKPESVLLEESQQLAFAVNLAKNGVIVTIKERTNVIDELKKKYGSLFMYITRE